MKRGPSKGPPHLPLYLYLCHLDVFLLADCHMPPSPILQTQCKPISQVTLYILKQMKNVMKLNDRELIRVRPGQSQTCTAQLRLRNWQNVAGKRTCRDGERAGRPGREAGSPSVGRAALRSQTICLL